MKYFDSPRQVKFFCPDGEGEVKFENGIAYQDEIICACCGSIFEIDDVIADAEFAGIPEIEAIVEYRMWINFSEYIGEF